MIKVGITERGDAGIDLSWVTKLNMMELAFVIVITKNLNEKFINELISYKNKLILHVTCTGYANTIYEPNVPNTQLEWLRILINKGFPIEQIVLRIDPIIPTINGIKLTKNVLKSFKNEGIKRVRYSFIDMYPHVAKRFADAGLPHPYNGQFNPTQEMINNTLNMFKLFPYYEFESCAEYTKHRLGCISYKDFEILGITISSNIYFGSSYQRIGCLCPSMKTELLTNRNRCSHKCLYCYCIYK